jgi:DUF4097 and DUF4098 domain-containing protein YvlB
VTVMDSKGPSTLEATSGDVRALNLTGGVTVKATSGDISIQLNVPASVTAVASSGDIDVIVPAGAYQVHTQTSSGDRDVSGITTDATSKNVLDLRASSGDVSVSAGPAA